MSWYRPYPAVRATVTCDGAEHSITWCRGALTLDDHDVGAELAMGALGADAPRCLTVYQSWRAVCTTDRPLAVWHETTQFGFHGATPIGGPRQRAWDAIPDSLQDVLAIASLVRAEREAARGGREVSLPMQLHRMMSSRVSDALRASMGPLRHEGIRVDATFSLHVVAVGDPPSVEIEVSRSTKVRIALGLPLGWLVDVWGRGLAHTGNRFVLRLHRPGGLALRWDVAGREVLPVLTGLSIRRQPDGSLDAVDIDPVSGGAFWAVHRR